MADVHSSAPMQNVVVMSKIQQFHILRNVGCLLQALQSQVRLAFLARHAWQNKKISSRQISPDTYKPALRSASAAASACCKICTWLGVSVWVIFTTRPLGARTPRLI
jgi:hypothetical protein